ncbi:MAG: sulfite exporter TauE/SafE family protein [Planctomycetes bacterium]|nr:sulfite exporter TauE/SafE family protein [Planctomycetota bacterium]
MPDAKTTLLILLGIVGVAFSAFWLRALVAGASRGERIAPGPYELVVGFLTDFFDTLGIGSFATTTTLYRARKTIDDRLLPGTLNVGHTLPTIVQAFIYTQVIEVEMRTLVLMIGAAVAGSLVGAPIVARWPRRNIQIGLGLALLVLCSVLVYRQLWTEPTTGAIGLTGTMLAAGVGGNFVLGALMTIGVGLYAPCLVMVSMLGMSPGTGFPIMMGSCAFLMPAASVPFIRRQSYSPRAALGLTLAGIPAVLIAAYIVKSLPLDTVKWLVAVIVVYTAVMLLRAASREPLASASNPSVPAQRT